VDLDGFRTALREGGVEEALDDIIAQFVKDAPGRCQCEIEMSPFLAK
jgi:hypothetical protein